MIYADYNSTSPVSPTVAQAMDQVLREEFGNPSAADAQGRRAREILESCRHKIAQLLDAQASEVVFLSGGTESCFLGILGALTTESGALNLVSSTVEHQAVLNALNFAERVLGRKVHMLPVNGSGELQESSLQQAIQQPPGVWSLMLANNETGVVFPISDLARRAKARVFHCDATQGLGKARVSFAELGVDLLSFSGHKFGAPKGVGVLVVREGSAWRSPMPGGGQEGGRRGGTEALAQIVGLTKALEEATEKLLCGEEARLKKLRETLEAEILQTIPGARVNAAQAFRLANTSSLCFPALNAQRLIARLDQQGIVVATGSACKASSLEPSHVLSAMGKTTNEALGTLRVSLGCESNEASIAQIILALGEAVAEEGRRNNAELQKILRTS